MADDVLVLDIGLGIGDPVQEPGTEGVEQFLLGPHLDTAGNVLCFARRRDIVEVGIVTVGVIACREGTRFISSMGGVIIAVDAVQSTVLSRSLVLDSIDGIGDICRIHALFCIINLVCSSLNIREFHLEGGIVGSRTIDDGLLGNSDVHTFGSIQVIPLVQGDDIGGDRIDNVGSILSGPVVGDPDAHPVGEPVCSPVDPVVPGNGIWVAVGIVNDDRHRRAQGDLVGLGVSDRPICLVFLLLLGRKSFHRFLKLVLGSCGIGEAQVGPHAPFQGVVGPLVALGVLVGIQDPCACHVHRSDGDVSGNGFGFFEAQVVMFFHHVDVTVGEEGHLILQEGSRVHHYGMGRTSKISPICCKVQGPTLDKPFVPGTVSRLSRQDTALGHECDICSGAHAVVPRADLVHVKITDDLVDIDGRVISGGRQAGPVLDLDPP